MPKVESEYSDLDKYEYINGDIIYYKKGTDIKSNPYGPAYIGSNGYKGYWIEDKLHRLDGPAIIYGDCQEQYFIDNKFLTKEQFEIHPERLKFLGKEHLICLR